jgi:hypothetical protein
MLRRANDLSSRRPRAGGEEGSRRLVQTRFRHRARCTAVPACEVSPPAPTARDRSSRRQAARVSSRRPRNAGEEGSRRLVQTRFRHRARCTAVPACEVSPPAPAPRDRSSRRQAARVSSRRPRNAGEEGSRRLVQTRNERRTDFADDLICTSLRGLSFRSRSPGSVVETTSRTCKGRDSAMSESARRPRRLAPCVP